MEAQLFYIVLGCIIMFAWGSGSYQVQEFYWFAWSNRDGCIYVKFDKDISLGNNQVYKAGNAWIHSYDYNGDYLEAQKKAIDKVIEGLCQIEGMKKMEVREYL